MKELILAMFLDNRKIINDITEFMWHVFTGFNINWNWIFSDVLELFKM